MLSESITYPASKKKRKVLAIMFILSLLVAGASYSAQIAFISQLFFACLGDGVLQGSYRHLANPHLRDGICKRCTM